MLGSRSALPVIGLGFLLVMAGCGDKTADGSGQFTGKILLDGKPIEVQGREVGIGRVILKFIPVEAGGKTVQTDAAADGSFLITGANGNGAAGIKPGKYKISVVAEDNGKDKFAGKYGDANATITRDISLTEKDFVIDLAKP